MQLETYSMLRQNIETLQKDGNNPVIKALLKSFVGPDYDLEAVTEEEKRLAQPENFKWILFNEIKSHDHTTVKDATLEGSLKLFVSPGPTNENGAKYDTDTGITTFFEDLFPTEDEFEDPLSWQGQSLDHTMYMMAFSDLEDLHDLEETAISFVVHEMDHEILDAEDYGSTYGLDDSKKLAAGETVDGQRKGEDIHADARCLLSLLLYLTRAFPGLKLGRDSGIIKERRKPLQFVGKWLDMTTDETYNEIKNSCTVIGE
ncbi:hypothetical protein H2200_011220 [Cladophialophora chaetospira]|uniref:Uncharacterized protein n=1 Tax=Cladophialophora chaetospira TaxID=386627 RepID=A0AA39CDL0_9EURO|nr:hypothetical protein H2200_011220 [Cladophialophora chaetospira]